MSQVGRDDVVAAYMTALRGIGGASYNTDAGSRVTRRFLDVAQLSPGDFPFVMVLDEPAPQVLDGDAHVYREDIRLWVYGVVRETSDDPWIANAPAFASQLRDDIVKITDANNKLGIDGAGTLRVTSWRAWTGVDPNFAACRVDVTIPWHFAPSALGPAP